MKMFTRTMLAAFFTAFLLLTGFPAAADLQFAPPYFTVLDSNGDPVSGAKAYFYESGTTTALDTYSDEDLTSANANPVVADSAGRFGPIWLKSQDYKVIIKDSSDVTIKTIDPVKGSLTVSGDDFKVSPQNPADMTVSVGAGTLFDLVSKTRVSKTAQTSSSITAPSSNPRYDIVYVDRLTGVIGVETGAEAASPSDPTIPDGKLPLARISLATSTTEITDNDITDIRELANIGTGSAAVVDVGADAGEVAINEQDWTEIASASTVNIGAAATERVNITGTTTITAFDTVTAGLTREVRFDGALTLTYNGTSLILPTSADITTAAGDVAKFVSEGSGNWRCVKYMKADGSPLASIITLETEQATTSGTEFDFTGIPSDTKQIVIMLDGVSLDGTDDLLVQIGDSEGIEATSYTSRAVELDTAPTITDTSDTTGFIVPLGTAARNWSGTITLSLMDSANNTWLAHVNGYAPAGNGFVVGSGIKSLSAELDRVRLTRTGTDNFDAGAVNSQYQ